MAVLLAEAALADRTLHVVIDRESKLRSAGQRGESGIALRVRVALADAGVEAEWSNLVDEALSHRFHSGEANYVCLRAARHCAWNSERHEAESRYRQALRFGAEADMDLDVENALWSLTALYTFPDQYEKYSEARLLALSVDGTRSFVKANSRTRELANHYIATQNLPDAHMWARHQLLESIRNGYLPDELESHVILSRIYSQTGDWCEALEHAVYSGQVELVKKTASEVRVWPEFLDSAARSPAPWTIRPTFLAIEYLGDLAPPKVGRDLVAHFVSRLGSNDEAVELEPELFKALSSLILEASDTDIERLVPVLRKLAPRKPGSYRLTDPGVALLAARLYRFRKSFRRDAAFVLGEMAVNSPYGIWADALRECGDENGQLIETLEAVAEREEVDLADSFSHLGHSIEATRNLWRKRLEFVARHPLGQRSEHQIGAGYGVPAEYFRDLDDLVVERYVDKLVSIGVSRHELVVNRASALAAAAEVVDSVSDCMRRRVVRQVRPLADQGIEISESDQDDESTLHPLSRFRWTFGNVSNVRASAGWLLARAAIGSVEYEMIQKIALTWIRSEDLELQSVGASILTLSHRAASGISISELAAHSNPLVRRASLEMPEVQKCPDIKTLDKLALDPNLAVRIGVIYAVQNIQEIDSTSYEQLRDVLSNDRSAIARAIAATVLKPSGRATKSVV